MHGRHVCACTAATMRNPRTAAAAQPAWLSIRGGVSVWDGAPGLLIYITTSAPSQQPPPPTSARMHIVIADRQYACPPLAGACICVSRATARHAGSLSAVSGTVPACRRVVFMQHAASMRVPCVRAHLCLGCSHPNHPMWPPLMRDGATLPARLLRKQAADSAIYQAG